MNCYHVKDGVIVSILSNVDSPEKFPGSVPGDGGAPLDQMPAVNEASHKVSMVVVFDALAGVVRERWEVTELTAEELARLKDYEWRNVRSKRDGLLMASDWRMLPDSPLTDEQRDAWREYRRALRDLTNQYEKPEDVIWPEQPQ